MLTFAVDQLGDIYRLNLLRSKRKDMPKVRAI